MINTERGINWGPSIFLITYHVILLCVLPFYFYHFTPSWGMILTTVVLLYLSGLSITAGYHRFYSHRAYKVNPIVEYFLLFFGAMACQGSALRWSYDHRIHHAHVDTDDDPYTIKKGFWYAHCLWILEKQTPIEPKVVPDLMRNPRVMFQDRHYPLLMVLSNAFTFLVFGFLLNDFISSFVLVWWFRMFLLHHFTWFINSLAHTWGEKPFCQEQTAMDNYLLSLVTFGEGYHNYHHTFANDYRNGIRWYHFDPTKWLIWGLSKVGLAHGLKKMDPYTIQKRMVMERKNLMLEHLKNIWYVKRDELEAKINELSERMVKKSEQFKKLKEQYRAMRSEHSSKELLEQLRIEIREVKSSLKHDWKTWSKMAKSIRQLRPLPTS